jgi:hypothetical protein
MIVVARERPQCFNWQLESPTIAASLFYDRLRDSLGDKPCVDKPGRLYSLPDCQAPLECSPPRCASNTYTSLGVHRPSQSPLRRSLVFRRGFPSVLAANCTSNRDGPRPQNLAARYSQKLGMHLTQVATIDRGRDCRQPTSEMCAGSLLPSIGDVGRLAPEKTVATGPIGFRAPPGQPPGAVSGHCCETRPAGTTRSWGYLSQVHTQFK